VLSPQPEFLVQAVPSKLLCFPTAVIAYGIDKIKVTWKERLEALEKGLTWWRRCLGQRSWGGGKAGKWEVGWVRELGSGWGWG